MEKSGAGADMGWLCPAAEALKVTRRHDDQANTNLDGGFERKSGNRTRAATGRSRRISPRKRFDDGRR
jgi:hypothetical protein